MPNPVRNNLHVDTLLGNLSVAYRQPKDHFIAGRVFPNVSSPKRSNKYAEFDRGYWNKDEMKVRGPGAESAGGGWTVDTTPNFYCERYAFHKDIDEVDEADSDEVFDLDREATDFVTLKDLLLRENLWVTNYFTAGAPGDTWTFDVDGAASASASFDPTSAANNDKVYWSDASSTPIKDVAQGKKYVLQSTGFEPNVLVVGYEVWEILKNHAALLARITQSGGVGPDSPAILLKAAIAAIFEVDEILIMKSIQNTADEGQTNAHSFIGGKNALLAYRAPNPGRYTPSAGYTFTWNGRNLGLSSEGTRIMRGPVANTTARRIEIESYFQFKKVSADLGYFFGGIVE